MWLMVSALDPELARRKEVRQYLGDRLDETSFAVDDAFRAS